MSAGQRLIEREAQDVELRTGPAHGPVREIFLWSRLALWAAAGFALLVFEPNRHPRADRWDDPTLTHELGWFTDLWARWDSVWFLRIAENGYEAASTVSHAATAFLPGYPLLVGILGRAFFDHYVLAGIVISLAATYGSFVLLHRLAEERLGADGARRAVLYLALFPMTLFLSAVYSEALFLVLALAAFALAERRRFVLAWLVVGLALLTRSAGLALIPAIALLAWRSPRRWPSLAGVVVPVGMFAAYPVFLHYEVGDALSFTRSQELWHRHLSHAGPLGGIWDGLRAGWAGVEQLVSGSHTHRYWTAVSLDDSDPLRVAALNLACLAFLGLFLVLTAVAWRRLGAPYGLYCAVSLAIPLSVPSERWPLLSLPRFGLVVFPFFIALAALGGRPRVHTAVVAVSSILLGVAVVQWSLWQWVA